MVKAEETKPEEAKARTEAAGALAHPPVVVDLGVNSRSKIDKLIKCSGPLYDAVSETVEILQADGVVAKNAQVVVVVVERVPEVFPRLPWN